MRPSLEDEDLSRIAELPITGDAAADTMRDLLTGALPASRAARCAFFTKLSAYSFRREIGTMAYALCLSEGLLVSGTDRSKLLSCIGKEVSIEKASPSACLQRVRFWL